MPIRVYHRPADRNDGLPAADRALPGYAAPARPSRYIAPHAPPGSHRLGVQHPGKDAPPDPGPGLAHDIHRRLSGETEGEFQTLLDFVKAMRFDRVGTFQFSFETGTPSEPLGDPIPQEVKEERYNRLMELQHGISLEINQTFVGKTFRC